MRIAVDAVIYACISDAKGSIINVEDAHVKWLAVSTLRNVIGTKTLSDILSDREHISKLIQVQYIPEKPTLSIIQDFDFVESDSNDLCRRNVPSTTRFAVSNSPQK